jgi:hypothetical protein
MSSGSGSMLTRRRVRHVPSHNGRDSSFEPSTLLRGSGGGRCDMEGGGGGLGAREDTERTRGWGQGGACVSRELRRATSFETLQVRMAWLSLRVPWRVTALPSIESRGQSLTLTEGGGGLTTCFLCVVLPTSDSQTASGAALASMRATSRRILSVAAAGASTPSSAYGARQGRYGYDTRRFVSRHRVASSPSRGPPLPGAAASPPVRGYTRGGVSGTARANRGYYAWSL